MREVLRGVRLSLELLLGRRLVLFAAVDALVVGFALLMMLLTSDGDPRDLYLTVFLLPALLLGLPALSGLVAVERRAGCLDLALSVPSAERYFLRRVAAVCGVTVAQGWLVLVLGWLYEGFAFPLLAPLLQVVVASAFLGAVALFWAVRLKTAAAVWLASMVTLALMGRWFFASPVPDRFHAAYGVLLPAFEPALPWLRSLAVLAGATILFFLYARRRLRRPELLIS